MELHQGFQRPTQRNLKLNVGPEPFRHASNQGEISWSDAKAENRVYFSSSGSAKAPWRFPLFPLAAMLTKTVARWPRPKAAATRVFARCCKRNVVIGTVRDGRRPHVGLLTDLRVWTTKVWMASFAICLNWILGVGTVFARANCGARSRKGRKGSHSRRLRASRSRCRTEAAAGLAVNRALALVHDPVAIRMPVVKRI